MRLQTGNQGPRAHIGTHTPEPQRCPDEHCWSVEHVQYPSMHFPLVPHWASVAQVPPSPGIRDTCAQSRCTPSARHLEGAPLRRPCTSMSIRRSAGPLGGGRIPCRLGPCSHTVARAAHLSGTLGSRRRCRCTGKTRFAGRNKEADRRCSNRSFRKRPTRVQRRRPSCRAPLRRRVAGRQLPAAMETGS
jgi:hypothetical protein